MKIQWSPRAERELAQLRDYIAQDSPFYARQFTERLILAVERLTAMPRSGRTVLHGARDLAGMEPPWPQSAPKP